ncbi:MTP-1 family protein [Fictibacillus sp. NRS-1165]|uniref:MTP-1 family protein n=1 Tax=Fictibacillus sp. NRS-1165 TaxID=3144463 RepID=UPI003D1D914B
MKLIKSDIKTCSELRAEYEKKDKPGLPEKILIEGVGCRDVYNITAPFDDDGQLIIAGRVEARESEQSEVRFFIESENVWVPREGTPVFQLQDPFVTRISGEIILGGVETFPHPTIESALGWRTVFYKGSTIHTLEDFFKGPDGMKDLRIAELLDGSIAIFTRPQGEKGGRGKIGFTVVPSLNDLTLEAIENAPLLENQFTDEEWGGANEIHVLSSGLVGVLGHIACFDKLGDRHYYPMFFVMDPKTGEHSDIELIAVRNDFLPGASKRPDLVDVVFSGGLVRKEDGTADLYAGISDAEAHKLTIQDPFLPYER